MSQYHQSVIDNARASEKELPGRPLAIALDTVRSNLITLSWPIPNPASQKGPEIRTGNTPGDRDIPIKAGTELNITTHDQYATASDDKNLYVCRLLFNPSQI